MRILLVEPGHPAAEAEISGTLESMQAIVGGTIEAVYPFEEPVALICNDEGKLLGLPLNRALRDGIGAVYDIISGTFFLCGAPPDSDRFVGLDDQQLKTYLERFAIPEMFLNVGGNIIILPYL